jgi:hypothetical protein
MCLPVLSISTVGIGITLSCVLGSNYEPISGKDEMAIPRRATSDVLGRIHFPLLGQNFLDRVCAVAEPVLGL